MKTSLLIALAAVSALSNVAMANPSAPYVKHLKIQGDTQENGKFDIDYVQLVERPGQPLTNADLEINAALEKMAKDARCDGGPVDGMTSEISQSTAVTFVSPRLLALNISGSYSCAGAAHPDGGSTAFVFDRALGKQIDIRTGETPDYETSKDPVQVKINNLIMAALVKQSKIEIKQRGPGDDCNETYNSLSFYPSDIFVTPKALIVQVDEPHVSMACQFETSIPLEKFSGIAKSGSLLDQLAKGAARLKNK